MNLSEARILLLALLNVRNAAAASYDVQLYVTALKDELRQSACEVWVNDEQWATFRESVYERHGPLNGKFPDDLLSLVNFVVCSFVQLRIRIPLPSRPYSYLVSLLLLGARNGVW